MQETDTTARRSGSIDNMQNISCFFLYSVTLIHKLDIIKKEYVIWSPISSVAMLPNY